MQQTDIDGKTKKLQQAEETFKEIQMKWKNESPEAERLDQQVARKHAVSERERLRHDGILDCPTANKPVFTPYAATHHGYSQIRFSGTKYLTHRVTYQQRFGTLTSNTQEISHIVYLGSTTSHNINPLHLTIESNVLNQTRKFRCKRLQIHSAKSQAAIIDRVAPVSTVAINDDGQNTKVILKRIMKKVKRLKQHIILLKIY